jgi:hypothetical protein
LATSILASEAPFAYLIIPLGLVEIHVPFVDVAGAGYVTSQARGVGRTDAREVRATADLDDVQPGVKPDRGDLRQVNIRKTRHTTQEGLREAVEQVPKPIYKHRCKPRSASCEIGDSGRFGRNPRFLCAKLA